MGESRRITVLLTNLVLVLACILGLELVVIGYTLTRQIGLPARAQVSTATRTASPTWSATPSPTASRTPTPSLTPPPSRAATLTLTPTITPTPSETLPLPGPPTLTPAIPFPASDAYRLKAWSPTEADMLIQMMEEYPNALGVRDRNPQAYYDAYRFAVDARREALLRFPDAPQAHLWRWGLAYDLALVGNSGAGDVYAELIAAALNQRQTDLEGLPEWFEGSEPRQALYMVNATPPPGFIGSYVIEIRSQGSAFIWLLQSASAFQAVNLLTHFDFIQQPQANWILTDLDGNPSTGDEVAIYFSAPPDSYSLDAPVVYSLSRMPPLFMPFLPERGIFQMGASYTPYWAVRAQPTPSPNNLYLRSTLFETCPVTVRQDYRWNQKYFPFQSQQFVFESLPDDLSRCEAVINHAVAFWGPQAAISLMEQLLPYWPPAQDENGNPYPADERDEFLYRLGINHALVGNFDEAVRYMTTVASQPSTYNSRWITPVKEFLRVYRTPQNIYTACRAAAHCDPDEAIRFLVASAPTTNNLLDYLWSWGVNTSSSGYFDFDGDEESERWFTVRNALRQKLSYWILARYARGVRALQVTYLTNTRPSLAYLEEAFIADESLEDQPAVLLDGQHAFSMKRRPDTQEPYLVEVKLRKTYPSRFWFQVDQARQSLYSGLPPELVQDQLIELQYYPGLLCAPTWSCDPYYYLLGLSSELAGDEKTAVEAYHYLWSNYSRSPYTTLARLRLEGVAYSTPTPTTPPTSTPVPEATQGILISTTTTTPVTSTVTSTPGTPTPSSTPTPTVTGTPPTATLTTTITPSPTITDTPDPYLLTTGQP